MPILESEIGWRAAGHFAGGTRAHPDIDDTRGRRLGGGTSPRPRRLLDTTRASHAPSPQQIARGDTTWGSGGGGGDSSSSSSSSSSTSDGRATPARPRAQRKLNKTQGGARGPAGTVRGHTEPAGPPLPLASNLFRPSAVRAALRRPDGRARREHRSRAPRCGTHTRPARRVPRRGRAARGRGLGPRACVRSCASATAVGGVVAGLVVLSSCRRRRRARSLGNGRGARGCTDLDVPPVRPSGVSTRTAGIMMAHPPSLMSQRSLSQVVVSRGRERPQARKLREGERVRLRLPSPSARGGAKGWNLGRTGRAPRGARSVRRLGVGEYTRSVR